MQNRTLEYIDHATAAAAAVSGHENVWAELKIDSWTCFAKFILHSHWHAKWVAKIWIVVLNWNDALKAVLLLELLPPSNVNVSLKKYQSRICSKKSSMKFILQEICKHTHTHTQQTPKTEDRKIEE